jgi:fumarate hydratase class II
MLVTALVPHIGYDRAARIARLAFESGTSLREAALSLGDATPAQLDEWLQAGAMLGPHNTTPQHKA